MMPPLGMMGAEEFCRLLARELQLDEDQVKLQAAFVDDLQVDSIRMVDLMLKLEEMGISFPLEAAWEIRTVGDAYRCYVQAAQSADIASFSSCGFEGGQPGTDALSPRGERAG